MSDDKEKKLKEREKAFDLVYGIVLGFVVIVVGFYMYHFRSYYISLNPDDWGTFGDFMGGTLNPLLAFFSFMLLLLNLKLQREQLDKTEEQLDLNREELKLTREELKKAADAQVDSVKVMNEQLKTQFLQRFDNLFFTLISQLTNRIEYLEERGVLNHIHQEIYKVDFSSKQWNRREYINLIQFIYCIINNIQDSLSEKNGFDTDNALKYQSKYMNILRAILIDKVVHFLIRDILDVVNTKEYSEKREIVEKFNLLRNLSFDCDNYQIKFWLIRSVHSLFGDSAFSGNSEMEGIRRFDLMRIFYGRYPRTFEDCLYNFFNRSIEPKYEGDGKKRIDVAVNDGSLIKIIMDKNENLKIMYGCFELHDFELSSNKLVLFFLNNEIVKSKYQFNIYFVVEGDNLIVDEILKIPLLQ